jgi:hypothetical protein
MSTAWYYVGGFGVLAWLLMSIGTGFKLGRAQVHGGWVITVAGVAFGVLAGLAALGTWIYPLTGAITNSFNPVKFAAFIVVLVAIGFTVAALLPDSIHGFTAGLGLALAWVAIPSLLRHGVVPGQAGVNIQAVLTELTRPLVQNTRWFG